MNSFVRVGIVVSMVVLPPVMAAGQTAPAGTLSDVLRNVVEENYAAYAAEDIDRIMKTVHSQSPGFAETRRLSAELLSAYDLAYELLGFSFVGQDNEYAYARVRQKTVKVKGPQFNNNIIDVLLIFRQEQGVWKFWSQALLNTAFIE